MLSFKPRMDIPSRMLLIVAILFSALTPTVIVKAEQPEPRVSALHGANIPIPLSSSQAASTGLDVNRSESNYSTIYQQAPVMTFVDDQNQDVDYSGDWLHLTQAGEYLNTISSTSVVGASASYTFIGATVTVYSRTGSNRGIMAVYLDGNFMSNVDLYNSSVVAQKLVYTKGLSYGQHTVMIVATGEKNPSSSGFLVPLGAIAYADKGIANDTEFDCIGTWSRLTQSGEYFGTMSTTSTTGAYATYTFTGSDMTLHSRTGPNRGIMAVYLDGTFLADVDLYTSSVQADKAVYSTVFPLGQHIVRIEATGRKNPSSTGFTVILGRMTYVAAREIDNTELTYVGDWSLTDGWIGVYGGTMSTIDTPGYGTYTFTGSVVSLYAKTWTNRGKMEVYLDGNLSSTVDLYTPDDVFQNLVYAKTVPYGQHTVTIKWTGEKNPASTGTAILLDRIVYVGEAPPIDVFASSTQNSCTSKTYNITGTVESDGSVSNLICHIQETTGDPINTRTGVFSFTLVDLSFPTTAGDLVFQRSYSSGALGTAGALGYGWTYNHEAHLIFPTDPGGMEGYVLFQSVVGNQHLFQIEADGSFTPSPGVIASLTKSGTTPITYTLTTSEQAIFRFDEDGRLTARQDAQGHTVDYDYDTQGRLIKISADGIFHFIEIGYDPQNRINSVSDYAGRQVSYGYSTAGDLTSVTDVLGRTWTYVYDAQHHMTQAKDPDGIPTARTEYDSRGRAYRQFDGEGNLLVRIVYNGDGSATVYDALGHFRKYTYNSHDISTGTVDEVGRSVSKTLDPNFRPATITDANENTMHLTWSTDGVNLLSKVDPAGNETIYTYDSLNNLKSVKDARKFTTTYEYDGKLLISSTDPLEGTTSYTYTPQGYLASATDPMERTTSYTYDSFGRRITMTDPSDHTWHYTYDTLGRVIDTTDPRGRVTHNQYNAAGKLVRVTQNYVPARSQNSENQYNIVTMYEYDARGNQTAVTDTYNHTTHYVYDDADRLLQTIDALGNTTTNVYDEAGRLVSTFDPLQHETKYEYDAAGRLIKTINALGDHTGITTFDVTANTSTVTDVLGRSTVFHYDELGRVIKVVDPLGHFTTTTYDPNGNVVTRTDQLNRPTRYEYDKLNRLTKTIDPDDGETETFYDAAGNRIATEDPLNHRTTYTYDEFGRLIDTTDPLERTTHTEYDTYGRRAATVDAAGHRTTYTYDALDRVIAVADDDGNTTHTTYDALGNVLVQTDANGNSTTTTYDALYRPLTVTDAAGNTTTNTYDEAGNLIEVEDALEHHTYYTYDVLNRQTAVTDPLGNTTHSYYDRLGNLSERVDANGVVTHYIYDELNRQKVVILNYKLGVDPDEETNVRYEFEYNEVGNRISVKDPRGKVAHYGYDALNRLIQKQDPLQNTWSYTYDLAGNRTSVMDAKNQTIQYIYDDANQLIRIDYPGTEPDVRFSYDLDGQRIEMIDGLGTTTWTYDDVHRLTSVEDAFEKTIRYDYDAVGNCTKLTYPDGKQVIYGYNTLNQVISVKDWDNQTTEYSYDELGHLATISRPNGISSQYDYDDAGRLVELHHNLGMQPLASYTYTYDPAGNRTQAIENLRNPQLASLHSGDFAKLGGQSSFARNPYPASVDMTALQLPEKGEALFAPAPQSESTETPSETPTETATETSTFTASPTATLTETVTPLSTDTETATPTETETPSPTASDTPTASVTSTPIPSGPLTIDYTYDKLDRLTNATYSDGRSFGYTYDPAGNVLELQENLGPGTVATTYTYDDANQVETATKNGVTWQYHYDENGSLIETLPNGNATSGAKRYTYNVAGYLTQVEEHDGSDWNTQAEMDYNGLGQRLSMNAADVVAHYVMDGDQLLTAEASGNTTFYLYGLGAIGEKTTAWSYALPDGMNTPRQLSDEEGSISLSARYTPWGDALDIEGTGNFAFGYFGGVMDAATGLLYVGNGQYYDPATGRFLTRNAKPNNSNPYVPWDPTGAILGPLAAMALFFGKRKTGSKWGTFLILLLVVGLVGMTLSACGTGIPTGQPVTATVTQPQGSPTAEVIWQTPTASGNFTFTPPAPINTLAPAYCAAVTPPDPTIDAAHQWDILNDPEQRHLYFKQSVFRHMNELPPEIPVELLVAMGWAETGEAHFWNNDYIPQIGLRDGILQVTEASGFHEKWARENQNGAFYNNTPMGIESNVIDAISYLQYLSSNIDSYTIGYGEAFNSIENSRTVRILLHYNGGPNPILVYKNKQGNRNYLRNVANMLESRVPGDIGCGNPGLVTSLRHGQDIVDTLVGP